MSTLKITDARAAELAALDADEVAWEVGASWEGARMMLREALADRRTLLDALRRLAAHHADDYGECPDCTSDFKVFVADLRALLASAEGDVRHG